MPRDYKFLEGLSGEAEDLLQWAADNPPRPRRRAGIPPEPYFLEWWDRQPPYRPGLRIFPTRDWHEKACAKLGLRPAPPFKQGIPDDMATQLLNRRPPASVITIYELLYTRSRYDKDWAMRVCEISYGAIRKETAYSFKTIRKAMGFLRAHCYIRRIWRGRPQSREPRYRHSCYELPFNLDHVTAWRIHRGRPG